MAPMRLRALSWNLLVAQFLLFLFTVSVWNEFRVAREVPLVNHVVGRRLKLWLALQASEPWISNCSSSFPRVFVVRKFQRLGNNVVQLARVLTYCEVFGSREVCVPRNFLFFRRTFVTRNGVTVHVGEDSCPDVGAVGYFFTPLAKSVVRYDFRLMCSFFRDEMLRVLPTPNVSDNVLYLHLRGGDIFSTFVHYMYGQPPCSYYLEAVRLDGAEEIELISEDSANPCFDILVRHGFRHVPGTVAWDFARLVYAGRLVISASSFCRSALALSPRLKRLYTFNYPWWDFGSHWNCVPGEDFKEHVMRNWTNSPRQVAMMKNSSCFWRKISLPKVSGPLRRGRTLLVRKSDAQVPVRSVKKGAQRARIAGKVTHIG